MRTHTNNELKKDNIKEEVKLCGWVQSRRDHGGVIFIDLRDKYGLTQIVFDPRHNKNTHAAAEKLRREWVVSVSGKVRDRKEGMVNPKLITGEIEIIVDDIEILNESLTPPFEVENNIETNEDIRHEYRYIDLRRPINQERLLVRHKILTSARAFLNKNNFLEIETPCLIKSTPEGAKDYIVPSSTHNGYAYSLPQSPQLYKQLLMAGGCDRYYQMARCFRDEDNRADRQPEFTQIDLEMSFVDQSDIIELGNNLYKEIFKACGKKLSGKIEIVSYSECMNKWGTDKPDMRFGLEFIDVSDIVNKSDFSVFNDAINNDGVVKCINVKGAAQQMSRKEIDKLIEFVISAGGKGLAWMKYIEGEFQSSVVKFFNEDVLNELKKSVDASNGDLILFIADKLKRTNNVLDQLRCKLGKDLKLYSDDEYRALWVVDYPLFEMTDEGKIEACHHPFSMPKAEDLKLLDKDPLKVTATLYDFVINGYEVHSGSIRIHDPKIQKKVFDIIGMSKEEVENKFGFLLKAFSYGAPPHGGFAAGVERLVMIICGSDNIKDVIAFPKNKNKENPMDHSPSLIEKAALVDLGLDLNNQTKAQLKKKG